MRKIMPLLLIAVAVVSGCSSSSTKTSASTSSGAGSSGAPVSLPGATTDKGTGDATSGKLTVEMDDYYFNPTFLKVTPGEALTLTLKNEGKATHTFTSTALNVDQTVEAGKSVDVQVTVPMTVPVEYHCRFHQGSGMQGALFQEGGAATVGGAGAASTPAASSSSSNGGYYN